MPLHVALLPSNCPPPLIKERKWPFAHRHHPQGDNNPQLLYPPQAQNRDFKRKRVDQTSPF